MDAHKEVDARGLNCPLPILKAKKALADMGSGELLRVVATDPGSMRASEPPPTSRSARERVPNSSEFGRFAGVSGRI